MATLNDVAAVDLSAELGPAENKDPTMINEDNAAAEPVIAPLRDKQYNVLGSNIPENCSIMCSHIHTIYGMNRTKDGKTTIPEDISLEHPNESTDVQKMLNIFFSDGTVGNKQLRYIPLAATNTYAPGYDEDKVTEKCFNRPKPSDIEDFGYMNTIKSDGDLKYGIDTVESDGIMFMGGFWWLKSEGELTIVASNLMPELGKNPDDWVSKKPDEKPGRKLYKFGDHKITSSDKEYVFSLFSAPVNRDPYSIKVEDQFQTFLYEKVPTDDDFHDLELEYNGLKLKSMKFTYNNNKYVPVFHACQTTSETQNEISKKIEEVLLRYRPTHVSGLESLEGTDYDEFLNPVKGGTRRRKKNRRKKTKKQRKGKRKRTKKNRRKKKTRRGRR